MVGIFLHAPLLKAWDLHGTKIENIIASNLIMQDVRMGFCFWHFPEDGTMDELQGYIRNAPQFGVAAACPTRSRSTRWRKYRSKALILPKNKCVLLIFDKVLLIFAICKRLMPVILFGVA